MIAFGPVGLSTTTSVTTSCRRAAQRVRCSQGKGWLGQWGSLLTCLTLLLRLEQKDIHSQLTVGKRPREQGCRPQSSFVAYFLPLCICFTSRPTRNNCRFRLRDSKSRRTLNTALNFLQMKGRYIYRVHCSSRYGGGTKSVTYKHKTHYSQRCVRTDPYSTT